MGVPLIGHSVVLSILNILQWLFYILHVTKMGLMARKKNQDSFWHHRTEPMIGDPGTGVVYSK